jgi:hypothetical protein
MQAMPDDDQNGSQLVQGENGHAEYSVEGLGDSLLAFFDKLMRGLPEERVRECVANVLRDSRNEKNVEMVKNLFVMAFHTRWCRGGKGERKVFYVLLKVLYERFPHAVLDLVELIPKFGYWKDLLSLLLECQGESVDYIALRARVFALFACQLKDDTAELQAAKNEGRTPKISLCAKFCPTEGGSHSKALSADKEICKLLFPTVVGTQVAIGESSWHHARSKYRRLVSALRKALEVPETLMCAQRWADIQFSNVPSICMDRHKYAFLNETKKGAVAHPDDPERVACRERLLAHIADKGIAALKGKQLFPHELVQQAIRGAISAGVSAVLDVQWNAVRIGLLDMVNERKAQLAQAAAPIQQADALCPEVPALTIARDVAIDTAVSSGSTNSVGLSRVVPMADVSGSMSGTPMLVSIALGILASEVTHPTFRDKVLTFHDVPTWHDLSGEKSFVKKVQSLAGAHWAGSTDFYAAMQLIADLVRRDNLDQAQIPDLLVVSDMQFNEAEHGYCEQGGNWESSYSKIAQLFHDLGLELHGRPLDAPQIIFWNVRSDTLGFPVSAVQQGVMLLSGFSPALMKFILSSEMEQELIVCFDGKAIKEKKQIDPSETLKRVLYEMGLGDVRDKLDAMPLQFLSM